MEIERKYLVNSLPEHLESYPHVEIEQGYLCTSPTLRIRKMGDVHVLTVKEKVRSASSAIVNREEEFALPAEKYVALRSKCDGHMVRKTRYCIDLRRSESDGLYTSLVAELDLFHGLHEGLSLVEVEFPSVEAADAFRPPAWFGADVSADPRYRNSHLAFNG
ncbi:MAG: CYTH domain-containing protein [Bacteroidales bacterium]|nr:CYTH domain-containing protein [Bacteroidales bacterium]